MSAVEQIIKVTTKSEQETRLVGKKAGQMLRGGECIILQGDLGSGKTVFVKGLMDGLDSQDRVTSPSFAIKNVYQGRLTLQHFDLYRLEAPGLMLNDISEALDQPDTVVAIEWGQGAEAILPSNRYNIALQAVSGNERIITIEVPNQ